MAEGGSVNPRSSNRLQSSSGLGSITQGSDREDIENCCICLDEIGIGDKASLVPCNHEYHKTCIDQWFRTPGSQRRCTYCRTPATHMRNSFQPDGRFQVQMITARGHRAATVRNIRFLMYIITSRVYLYTLATQTFFSIFNSSDRSIEVIDPLSRAVIHTLAPGAQQRLSMNTLNRGLVRFHDEPQVEITIFSVDNFTYGAVRMPIRSTATEAASILRAEMVNIENRRNERLAIELSEMDMEEQPETDRMRRRRERSERAQRGRGGRRGR